MNSMPDDDVAKLQRKLDECVCEKRGLRARLRKALAGILGGRVRKEDFADSSGFNDLPRLEAEDPK